MQILKHTSICMKMKSRNHTRIVELCKHEKNTCEKLQGHNEWLRTFCQQGSSVEETWILPARPPDGMRLISHHAGGNTSAKNFKGDFIVNKRLMKVAVTTALTVAFAVPAFANPFSDVPAKHWAYDSVNKLVQAGIVDGYGDGTFRGDKTMTRYEMATIVAKAMNKSLNADQKATVDRLSKEFGTELTTMGIKVDSMQNQVDNMVKISGDARVRYFNNDATNDVTDYRARVSFDGKVNNNMKFNLRLTSGNIDSLTNMTSTNAGSKGLIALDTANVTIKGLGMTNTIGRQDLKLGAGYLVDTQFNGISSQSGALKLYAGNLQKDITRFYGAEYKTDVLGAKVTADYMKDVAGDKNIYGANTTFGLVKGVNAIVEYYKFDGDVTADAKAYGLKFNDIGLSALYRDVEAGAFSTASTMAGDRPFQDSYITDMGAGFKGLEVRYDKALDKNVNLTLQHQDFEAKATGVKLGARTNAGISVKF